MNEGLLDRELLEKDIEQIEYYKEEERKTLEDICSQLEVCREFYQSQNIPQLLNDTDNPKMKCSMLYSKRNQYATTLKKAIELYETLSNETIKKFDGGLN